MPDLLFHIIFPLLIAVSFKIKNWKLLITGAILPDLSRILMIFFNYLGFDQLKTFVFFEPMHTPFINIFLSLSIALLFINPIKNFLIIYFGVVTHLILDLFQYAGSFGHILFYPFYYKEYALNIIYGGNIFIPLVGLLILIPDLFLLKEKNSLNFSKKFYYSLIPLVIILIFLISTRNSLIENNVHGTNFILNPELYINHEVSLYNSKVISLNPLQLDEMGRIFNLKYDKKLELNSIITIDGVYKENKIEVSSVFFNNLNKYYFSIIGLLFYLYLIIKKD